MARVIENDDIMKMINDIYFFGFLFKPFLTGYYGSAHH